MEILLAIILVLMILGSIYALHARDLLSAVISYGIVGFGLVICFLLLQAPDLAIVQVVVEIITLIVMIAVILNSTREEEREKIGARKIVYFAASMILGLLLLYFFNEATGTLNAFGEHVMRMSKAYVEGGAARTGSANLVTGVIFDFRGYDTLGEATVLFTAAVGVLTILRLKGKK